ncbi:MAG: class I SAM-dependent methyltransferase [Anaerolineae bacterium]|nr:class I SAM-dependent methyltransferase [Anaerolineae bacterium]
MNYTPDQIRDIVATFQAPDRGRYPELDGYARDELYEDCSGGGGLYLAAEMVRTMRLQPGDIVLDLGCGKGVASLFLAQRFGVQVIAVNLWTPAAFLDHKFTARGVRDRIIPLHLDVTCELPFAEKYFDAVFCMNSFSFYGGSLAFLRHLLKHVKPGGGLCIGSEVLTDEFTPEQLELPPYVYAFRLPPPDERVDVFEEDFKKQHTPRWWRELFESSGLLDVEHCRVGRCRPALRRDDATRTRARRRFIQRPDLPGTEGMGPRPPSQEVAVRPHGSQEAERRPRGAVRCPLNALLARSP